MTRFSEAGVSPANITGNASVSLHNSSYDPGGSAILPPIGNTNRSQTNSQSHTLTALSSVPGDSLIPVQSTRPQSAHGNKDMHRVRVVLVFGRPRCGFIYSSQQSVYITDHAEVFAESVFEMDSMTASLLRRGTKKSGRMKERGKKKGYADGSDWCYHEDSNVWA